MHDNMDNMEQFFDDSWEHMHELLEEHLPEKEKKKKRFLFWWLGAAAFIIGLGIYFWEDARYTRLDRPTEVAGKNRPKVSIPTYTQKEERTPKKHPTTTLPSTGKSQTAPKKIKHSNQTIAQKTKHLLPVLSQKKEPTIVLGKSLTEKNLQNKPLITSHIDQTPTHQAQRKQVSILAPIEGLMPTPLVFAQAEVVPLLTEKKPKKWYRDCYAGISASDIGNLAMFGGIDVGRSISSRFDLDIGLGYRRVQLPAGHVDSTGQYFSTISFKENSWNTPSSGSLSSTLDRRSRISIHRDLIELPLKLHYRISPRWSVHTGVTGIYQFAAVQKKRDMVYSNQSTSAPIQVPNQITPINNLTNQFYTSFDVGISYKCKPFNITAGYNNWNWFKSDNQLYLSLKYRF
ncbi:MAG TPA: hypothetical protein ENK85_07095 [Saprospiraceae bacterium]|nr:hypothetical protein [Saprospiraceae bacterium]